MNFKEKLIVKKMAKTESSVSKFEEQKIKSSSKKMDKIFNPFLI